MADLTTKLCGITLDSPIILGSGPAGFDAISLASAAKAGAGAVVTKSIAVNGFLNNSKHMIYNGVNSLLNNEGGSDLPLKQWTKEEIPKAKEMGVKTLITSVYGYGTTEDTIYIAEECAKAGADIIEIVSGYSEPGELVTLINAVKTRVDIPVIAKVNSNWKDMDGVAYACDKAGADGITVMDSIGPVFRVDITTGKPLLGGNGYGYLTGTPILPLTLRYVHDIAKKSKKDIIGLGGVTSGESAMEMLMSGASAVGVCSAAILRGHGVFSEFNEKLSDLMDRYGYPDIASLSRRSLEVDKLADKTYKDFYFIEEKCKHCFRCVKVCAYRAREFSAGKPVIDESQCRVCGLCIGVCNTGAIGLR